MRSYPLRLAAILLLGGLLLGLAARLRGPEYDEGYTAFVTGTAPRPDWPTQPFRAGGMRAAFAPASAPWAIADNLRRTDVHPPLYFWIVWAWRRVFGPDLFVTRLLSVTFSLGALVAVAKLARAAAVPAIPALLITLGCFGFVETGIVARGFALAQCLTLWGLVLTLRAGVGSAGNALGAGLLLGAASFTNYLAGFPAAASLLWLGLRAPRRAAWLVLGLVPFFLSDFSFFWAQRASRIGQFSSFSWTGFIAALGHAIGGAILGGLPLYLGGWWRTALSAGLALLLALLLVLPVLRWQRMGKHSVLALLALAAGSAPLGLLLMALASHSLPVEIRYLAFALPPFALLLASAIGSLPRPRLCLAFLLLVQAAAIAGLLTRPETMQPEQAAARAAFRAVGDRGLALLPRGNDGVGIVAAFLTAAAPGLHVLLVEPNAPPEVLRAKIARWPCVTAAAIAVDGASRATLPLLDRLAPATGKGVDARSARLLGCPIMP